MHLFSLLDGLVGWVVGWYGQVTYSNAHKSDTCVKSFHFESPYQVSNFTFRLVGWLGGRLV